MPRIVIIGAGLAGLLTGILLARRGKRVTILEKDGEEPGEPPPGPWVRKGVGQASQTHAYLALAGEVLRDEAPDIWTAVEHSCVVDRVSPLDEERPLAPAPRTFFDRRLAFERLLLAAARSEPLLELRSGMSATSLVALQDRAVPHVTGVECTNSSGARDQLDAGFVIDASGRKSRVVAMLGKIGARPVGEEIHKCDFQYLSRWYVLNDGECFPNAGAWVRGRSQFGGFLLCPAGGNQFSITYTLSVHDPLRHVLRNGESFDEFAISVPRLAQWVGRARATADPVPFAGIENRRRRLADDDGPIVTGFALVGDSAMHTNPTLGRGTSLAFKQAQFVARNIDRALADPSRFAAEHAHWLRNDIGVWFDSQVAADAEHCDRLRALATGAPLPPLSSEARFGLALQNLAADDPAIARQAARMVHMLVRPSELLARTDIRQAVATYLSDNPAIEEVREGLARAAIARSAAGGGATIE